MTKFQLVHFNRLDCELGRYPILQDYSGAPLMLAAVAQSVELRQALDVMEPGDRLEFREVDEPSEAHQQLAADAYAYAEEHYGDKGARFDVIVECMSIKEIAAELEERRVANKEGAIAWAKRRAGLHHEQELNQAWNGPESCIGSSLYNPEKSPYA